MSALINDFFPGESKSYAAENSVIKYIVQPGDTLVGIAKACNFALEDLRKWNMLENINHLKAGQTLKFFPKGSNMAPATDANLPCKLPDTPPNTYPVSAPVTIKSSVFRINTSTQVEAVEKRSLEWRWPTFGHVVQTFNANSKGIDIAGVIGDPVYAAADGKVLYSGNGVRGLGNLVIISHQSDLISAYAHNQMLVVKAGQLVRCGTKIAEVGDTDASSPRIHFEIRRQGVPVDPTQYLPMK